MQLIDCCLLEVETLQYKPRPLIAAFMYIVIGKDFEQFTTEIIVERFPSSSLYLLDPNFAFNNLFARYLELYFGIELEELLPSIQYASTFAGLEVCTKLPSVVEGNKKEIANVGNNNAGPLRRLPGLPDAPPGRAQVRLPKKGNPAASLSLYSPAASSFEPCSTTRSADLMSGTPIQQPFGRTS
jgi:hypothetical protein